MVEDVHTMNNPIFSDIASIETSHFSGEVGSWPSLAARQGVRRDLVLQILASLSAVLERQQAAYPYLDTKFNIATGEEFPQADLVRGRASVYPWIQGRGMEALVEHALWLAGEPTLGEPLRTTLLEQISTIMPPLVKVMERTRSRNGGRLPFMMSQEGGPLSVAAGGEVVPTAMTHEGSTMSDLFYSKGLLAAGSFLKDEGLIAEAERLFSAVHADVVAGRFVLGQVALDPKNPVQRVPGRHSHAGRMIGLGAATLFYRYTGKALYREIGFGYIRHLLEQHSQRDDAGPFQRGDFWEFVDAEDATAKPWVLESGAVWCDPGHATEFVGLAFAFLRGVRATEGGEPDGDLLAQLIQVLLKNFENGFTGRGIVKAYDLKGRQAINADMPWWNLPETMRAAALGATLMKAQEPAFSAVFAACWSAFCDGYLRRERGLMAVQCLDSTGAVANVVPATPDADPGYHTGLSLIGALPWFDEGC